MEKTDRQTDAKSSRWSFTAFEAQWAIFETMPDIVAEWGWQTELCPDTNRRHYQGYVRTKRQVRFAQLAKSLPKVHLEVARNWDALLKYCQKTDTAVEGTQKHQYNPNTPLTMADAMILIASYMPYNLPLTFEQWGDAQILRDRREQEYWSSVNQILYNYPGRVALLTQPQYIRAWVNTRDVWIQHCLDSFEMDEFSDLPSNSFLDE